jgi:hypothetical protein
MSTALVLSLWVTDEDGTRYPFINDALSGQTGWTVTDVTAQQAGKILFPGLPNAVAVFVTCSPATLAVIDANVQLRVVYDDGSRLASRTLNNAQFNALRNFLINRFGWTTAQVDAAIGTSHGGRTVAQIVDALLAYLRTV